jgi:hypothetical protein
MQQKFPLEFLEGHLFATIDGARLLIDTGAPTSFGSTRKIIIGGETFDLPSSYMGLNAEELSDLTGVSTIGLLGADILNSFDVLIDVPGAALTFSQEELSADGDCLALGLFMGIPIIEAKIAGETCRMFFDTGAKLSYFQGDTLASFPSAGNVTDFYPGFGRFETATHMVEMKMGLKTFTVRCGTLPGLLGMTLMMAGVNGIVGNEVLRPVVCGYLPRREMLVLSQ